MAKILVSWIGDTDLDAAKPPEKRRTKKQIGLGPICEAIKIKNFDKVFLLENYGYKGRKEELENYLKWLKAQVSCDIKPLNETLDNPTDYQAIYDICLQRVNEIYRNEPAKSQLTFHLSPGTPQMHTVWVILFKTHFPEVSLIQSSIEGGVKDVSIPFKIAPQLIQDFVRSTDEKLESLTAAKTAKTDSFDNIIGKSEAIQRVKERARRAIVNNYPVLILGETGTGKELFATAIHNESSRKQQVKEIITVNCGAIPKELIESELFGHTKGSFTGAIKDHEGYFKQADKGTLFLDEIGDLPLKAQVKLLRVLQSKKIRPIGAKKDEEVDVRIIAATHQNLYKMIKKGTFREDLFYRLNVLVLNIPPLRERKEDLELLIDYLFSKIKVDSKNVDVEHKYFSVSAKNLLFNYDWPGNIRELQSVLVKTAVYSNNLEITSADVTEALSNPILEKKIKKETPKSTIKTKEELAQPIVEPTLNRPLGNGFSIEEVISEVARHYLNRAIEQTNGNKTKAAELLGLGSYQSFTNWMKTHSTENHNQTMAHKLQTSLAKEDLNIEHKQDSLID
ncbi:MAG: sigma 54-interacting transcriptional regulator [Blastocatellia bacterium]